MQVPATLTAHWLLLKDLSAEEKLSLIELLVKSLQMPPTVKNGSKKPPRNAKPAPTEREQMIQYILSYQNAQPSFGDAATWQHQQREDREIPR
jgi:hypothetical protein